MIISRHASPFSRNFRRSPGLVSIFDEINREMASTMVEHLFTGFLDSSSAEGKTGASNLEFPGGLMREMKRRMEGSSTFNSPWRSFFKEGWGNETEEGYFWTAKEKSTYLFLSRRTDENGGFSTGESTRLASPQCTLDERSFPGCGSGRNGAERRLMRMKNISPPKI